VRDVINLPLPRPLSVAEVENAGDYPHDNGTRIENEQCQLEVHTFVHSNSSVIYVDSGPDFFQHNEMSFNPQMMSLLYKMLHKCLW